MVHRKWRWMLAALISLSIAGLGVFSATRTPPKPIKIYKMVTPSPPTRALTETNTEKTTPSVQDHAHGTLPHSHSTESSTSDDEFDWREDRAFDSTVEKNDPWKQTYPEHTATEDTDDTYPPRDWYKTEDPELHAEYFYAQLLKQFGDIPEVHVIGEHQKKMAKKKTITEDDFIRYLEASEVLWPNEENAELLENLRKDQAKKDK